jgi:hypothetical protein
VEESAAAPATRRGQAGGRGARLEVHVFQVHRIAHVLGMNVRSFPLPPRLPLLLWPLLLVRRLLAAPGGRRVTRRAARRRRRFDAAGSARCNT